MLFCGCWWRCVAGAPGSSDTELGYGVRAVELAGTCLSRNLHYFPTRTAANPRVEDGAVRHHVVKDGPGLSEPDILGKFGGFCQF